MRLLAILGASLGVFSIVGAASLEAIRPKVFSAPSPHVISPHVLKVKSRAGSRSAKLLHMLRAKPDVTGTFGLAPVIPAKMGVEYLTEIQWGGRTYQVILDTGSADTWLVESNFTCVTVTGSQPVAQSVCNFGPTWKRSKSFKRLLDLNMNISYGDGEFATGIMGQESVTLAGITVHKQEVGVVTYAAWNGDAISSGLVGLAFPPITSAFKGNDPTQDTIPTTQVLYNPLFTNMYKNGTVPPLFSLALERGTGNGLLAIGGLPPVEYDPGFACAPFQIYQFKHTLSNTYQFYAIKTTLVYEGSTNVTRRHLEPGMGPHGMQKRASSNVEAIVDSGTTLLYLPPADTAAINALYSPPATFSFFQGVYVVDCNATAPSLGINVGGKTFNINPKDMILPAGEGICISAVTEGGAQNIYGDVFLKNVLAIFDVGAGEMRFAAREFY